MDTAKSILVDYANPVTVVREPVPPAHYTFLGREYTGGIPAGGSDHDAH